jgi:hypothetical protein
LRVKEWFCPVVQTGAVRFPFDASSWQSSHPATLSPSLSGRFRLWRFT